MKKKRHQEEQIIRILREAERGDKSIGEVCREHGITEPTFYRWRKKYGGMEIAEARRLRELEKENGRLKRIVADLTLENDAIKEFLEKKL
jgi:putative transposase